MISHPKFWLHKAMFLCWRCIDDVLYRLLEPDDTRVRTYREYLFLEKVYGGLVLPYWIRKATTAKEHCRYTETEHMTRRCGQHGDYNTKLYVFHARLQQHCNATCCCTARKCTGKCHNANPLTFHSPTHFSLSLCIQDYMLLQYRPWTRKAKHFFARPLLFN